MLEIIPGQYLSATPYGAYYAASSAAREPLRDLVFALMDADETPLLSEESACRWSGKGDPQSALELLHLAQQMAVIQGSPEPRSIPHGQLERAFPMLLPALSDQRQALLADNQGFYLSVTGFHHETAEELAAFSAEATSLHARYSGLLGNNLGISDGNLGVVDASGASQIGVWPLHVAGQRFALVIGGRPRLHQPQFADLIWLLRLRYGNLTD